MGLDNKMRDDFWDIDKLVPKKKTAMSPFSTPTLVTYEISGVQENSSGERKLTVLKDDSPTAAEERSYIPKDHGLIKRVTIRRAADKFDFYGNFRKAALIYYDYKTPKCDFVPYYSYMPQYTQLTSEQKAYYFYWRDEVRRGKYIKSDYSYLYLYVYEILNLPDKVLPKDGVRLLCSLWREYRKSLPRIDSFFSVWLQDYCLVHELSCPTELIRDFIFTVAAGVDFKEFYLSEITNAEDKGTDAAIAYLSDYDWRSTKYAADENAPVFERHMLGAMKGVVELYFTETEVDFREVATLRRAAFPHSLCTHAVKCNLEIEYLRISRDDGLRRLISAAVRYTENKLRALIGVKSRLGIKALDDRAKSIIDRYFDNVFAIERIRKQKENAPEYEKRYDAQREKLSFAHADEIEKASWVTTARLVSDGESKADEEWMMPEPYNITSESDLGIQAEENSFECEAVKDTKPSFASAEPLGNSCFATNSIFTSEDIRLISLLLNGEDASITDEEFERINEAALSSEIGDVILEYTDGGYALIEDYRDELAGLIGNT